MPPPCSPPRGPTCISLLFAPSHLSHDSRHLLPSGLSREDSREKPPNLCLLSAPSFLLPWTWVCAPVCGEREGERQNERFLLIFPFILSFKSTLKSPLPVRVLDSRICLYITRLFVDSFSMTFLFACGPQVSSCATVCLSGTFPSGSPLTAPSAWSHAWHRPGAEKESKVNDWVCLVL